MEKKRKENLNIIFLLIIIFAGINYSIFSFVIQPLLKDREEVEYELKSSSYALSQKDRDEETFLELQNEVKLLEKYELTFDDYIKDEFDTIETTVELYEYIKNKSGIGESVSYDLGDIMQGIESKQEEEVSEDVYTTITDKDDPNYDPYIDPNNELYDSTLDPNFQAEGLAIQEEIVNESDDVLYRNAVISLNVKIHKNNLYRFLNDFDNSLSRYFTVSNISITSQGAILETENQNEILEEEISLEESNKSENLMDLVIEMKTYVKDGVVVESEIKDYDFYDNPDTHQLLKDLF